VVADTNRPPTVDGNSGRVALPQPRAVDFGDLPLAARPPVPQRRGPRHGFPRL